MNRVIATGAESGTDMEAVLVRVTTIQIGIMAVAAIGVVVIEGTIGEHFHPLTLRHS
jgi:hypothetical protein